MSLRGVLAIGHTNLVRLLRDRLGLFFILVLPMLIILILGLQFGGGFTPRIGVVAHDPGPLGEELIGRLANQEGRAWQIERYENREQLEAAIGAGRVSAGVVLPDAYDARLRAGEQVELTFSAPPREVGIGQRSIVAGVVADQAAAVRAARVAADEVGRPYDQVLADTRRLQATLPAIGPRLTTVGEAVFPAELLGFSIGAHSQLVLFMFLTSLTGASQLILSRQLGVSRRMVSTPTSMPTILAGEAVGRLGVALFQGIFIVIATALLFGVTWGHPLAAGAVIVAFGLVAAGTAMLIGAVATNAEQAGSIGVFAGLGVAAIGGAMAPPEIFPPFMQTVSWLTPHRWAIDAFRELGGGAGVGAVIEPVGVLLVAGVVLLGLATWRLRVSLTR